MMLAQQNADHSGGAVLNAGSCFGGWKLLQFGRFGAGLNFCSLAAATSPAGRLLSLFWRTNKLRPCQTIFLSWMTCFHQNKILIGEQNLFGEAACQKRLGVGKTDTRTLIWFRLKKWFFLSILKFCAKLYHHLKSGGCSAKSFPGCCCKLISCPHFCRLCFWGVKEGGDEWGWYKI